MDSAAASLRRFCLERVMFSILGLDHVVLRAANVARMQRFYCEVLGCTLEREREDLGLTQLRAGSALIDLVDVEGELGRKGGAAPGREGRNLDHLCLRIEPFDPGALTAHRCATAWCPAKSSRATALTGRGLRCTSVIPKVMWSS